MTTGGSPGINSLISVCAPVEPEIDVERNTFASIPSGAPASTGHNTIFAATTIGNTTAPKTYYIRNEGTADLTINSIVSSNNTEFTISTNPAPITLTPGEFVAFEIEFSPSSIISITRTSIITINNTDADENPYTFDVQGNANCAASAILLSPANGPKETIVTVTGGTDFGGLTTASFNGLAVSFTVISSSEIEVVVPNGATTGSLEIDDDMGCLSSELFTVIDNKISSCEGNSGATPLDLFISEITDNGTGSHTYIEIYNETGSSIDLGTYKIEVYNNGNISPFCSQSLFGTIANNDVIVIAIGGADASDPEGGYTADFIFPTCFGINEDDNIRLYNGATWVDLWGDTSGSSFTVSSKDYTYRRKNQGLLHQTLLGMQTIGMLLLQLIIQILDNTISQQEHLQQ